jgi:protein-disulfide isomerase
MMRFALAASALLLAACTGGEGTEIVAHKTAPIDPWLGPAVLGDAAAPVEIVEYASTVCGHCKAFHEQELPTLRRDYIDTGKARLRYVVLPTEPAQYAIAGGAIARCAGKDKFFDVIQALFEQQDKFAEAKSPRELQKLFNDIGAASGLSSDQVGTCLEHQPVVDVLNKELEGMPDSVTGTPAFFVDGEQIAEKSAAAIGAAVDAKLAAKAAPAAPATP